MKTCAKCNQEKEATHFNRCSCRRDKLQVYCKDCMKQFRQSHYNELRTYKHNYDKSHKEQHRNYVRNRCKTDPLFKLKRNLNTLLSLSLKKRRFSKTSKTYQLLGCDYETAKNWLEYTWFLNYGTEYSGQKVEIDHIIPSDRASSEAEIIALQHISNLQYLTPEDNNSKLARYEV